MRLLRFLHNSGSPVFRQLSSHSVGLPVSMFRLPQTPNAKVESTSLLLIWFQVIFMFILEFCVKLCQINLFFSAFFGIVLIHTKELNICITKKKQV